MVKTSNRIIHTPGSSNIITTLLFAACAIAGLLSVGSYVYYRYRHATVITQSKKHLSKIAKQRTQDIGTFLQKYITELNSITQNPVTQNAFVNKQNTKSFENLILPYEEIINYKDIFLVANTGDIIFSVKHNSLVGDNIQSESLEDSLLAQSCQRSIMSVATDVSPFSVDLLSKEPTLFICTPVTHNKKMVGVLAMHVNHLYLYNAIRNYSELGATGEIVVGKTMGDSSLIIAPTRHVPDMAFKHKGVFKHNVKIPLQEATQGNFGVGTGIDYRNIPTIAAWHYIPQANWGLVAKIDLAEVVAQTQPIRHAAIITLLLFVLLLLICMFRIRTEITQSKSLQNAATILFNPNTIRIFGVISCIICTLVLSWLLYYRKTLPTKTIEEVQEEVTELMQRTVENISIHLDKVTETAQSIAQDLTAGRLKKEDLPIRMNRDLEEREALFGIIIAYAPNTYNQDTKLYAPFVTRNKNALKTYALETLYDYTQPEKPGIPKTDWYTIPIEKGASWIDPFVDKVTKERLAFYSVPFYPVGDTTHKAPIGIVSVAYKLNTINQLTESLRIGQTGYGFVLSKKGAFIQHPLEEYITQSKTIFELAQEQANDMLQQLGKRALEHKPFSGSYYDQKTSHKLRARLQPIAKTNWSLGMIFVEQEVAVPQRTLFHYNMLILLISVLTILLGLTLLFRLELYKIARIKKWAITATILLLSAQGTLWYLIILNNKKQSIPGVKIIDPISLDKFFDEATRTAQEKNEPEPIAIPTGIFINSLTLPDSNHVSFAAYVWQKYEEQFKNIAKDIQLPGASDIKKEKAFDETENNANIVGWKVRAKMTQKSNFKLFPFDTTRITIPLIPQDITQNIMLLPDLTGYLQINPSLVPGTSKKMNIPGFTTEKAFFSYEKKKLRTSFGMKAYTQVSDRYQLNYILLLSRNLINAFVVYLLPLLIILFTLFAMFLLIQPSNVRNISSTYTGLLFALVVLHRTLRNNYPAGDVLYLEYFFLFVYSTIMLLVLHGLLFKMYENSKPFLRYTVLLRMLEPIPKVVRM